MSRNVGLWIDHKKAVMVILEGKLEEIRLIESNLEEQLQVRGGSHMKTTRTAQYFPAEDHKDRHCMEKLNKYYETVISALRGADCLLIFGPGEAKFELEKRLTRKSMLAPIAAVESADKMTDRQIAAKARKFFQEQKHLA